MKNTLILFFLCTQYLFAQNVVHKCITNEYVDYLEESNPNIKEQIKNTFDLAQLHSRTKPQLKAGNIDTIFRIPVVFHVVYNGNAQNTDISLLESQIQVLNDDFRRLNADTSNTRAIFQDRAADVGFEFFFATIDPDGNPTSGITRTSTNTTFSFFDLDAMKSDATGGKDPWNTSEYMNIWVCDLGGFILGFAYPPVAAPNWDAGQINTDPEVAGVVIHYEVIGKNNPGASGQLAIADQGRTCVHEVGHYWGLRHIWGDSGDPFTGNPDCDITQDDGFDDTPHMGNNSQQTGCSFAKNTCTNGESPDEPDMVENYMDYSTEVCQNMFTQEQADLMRSMAVIGRPGLAKIILNDTFNLTVGTWIVINGTDTFQIDANSNIIINTGDEVLFLNENNGVNYIAQNNLTFSENSEAIVTEDGELIPESTPTAINSFENLNISIYPNPAKDKLILQNSSKVNLGEISIYTLTGQLIDQIDMKGEALVNINLEVYPNGIYYFCLERNNQIIATKKISVLK